MLNIKIYNIILPVLLSVFISCSSVSSPSAYDKPSSGDNNSETGGSGGNATISKKTMFFEFKFDGESSKEYSYADFKGHGVKDILFQMEGTRDTYLFRAKNGMEGYYPSTMFSKNLGKDYDIPFYIGDSALKKEYNSSDTTVSFSPKISFGVSLSQTSDALLGHKGVHSVYKTPFVAPLKEYDENIHTNVARFNVHHYELTEPIYPDGPIMTMLETRLKFIEFKKK